MLILCFHLCDWCKSTNYRWAPFPKEGVEAAPDQEVLGWPLFPAAASLMCVSALLSFWGILLACAHGAAQIGGTRKQDYILHGGLDSTRAFDES